MRHRWQGAAAAALSAVFGVVGVARGEVYTLTDLGTLQGTYSFAYALNASGQVAGAVPSGGNLNAFLSAPGGGALHALGVLPGGTTSSATGVNATGQVVGSSSSGTSTSEAFISGANGGTLHDLGTLTGGSSSYAYGVNDNGQVVGYSTTTVGMTQTYHAFLSTGNTQDSVGGTLHDLGVLAGGSRSFGEAVNASGAATGYGDNGVNTHAFYYSGSGALHDLGTLGGNASYGYGINDSGQVVGGSSTSTSSSLTAFVSDAGGGKLHSLGTLGGSTSTALGINDAGTVVGYSSLASGSTTHAFIEQNGAMLDLNSLVSNLKGATVEEATAIDANGDIVGYGLTSTGATHAFLLTAAVAVPEPSTYALTALGVGLVVWRSRRRGRAR